MKRFISMLLTVVLVMQCTSTVFAADIQEKNVEAAIENEIQSAKQELHNIIYDQLERQNALEHLPIYEEILFPRIEYQVMCKYGNIPNVVSSNGDDYSEYAHCEAPNGGVATYTLERSTNINCVETFLNREDTLYYLLNKDDSFSFTLETAISTLVGAIPNYGTAYSGLLGVLMVLDRATNDSINRAKGYTDILVVDQGGTGSYLITGWFQYPYMVLWQDRIISYKFYTWKPHDPWA